MMNDNSLCERQCSPTHEGEPNNNEIRKDDTEPNVLGVASCSAPEISYEDILRSPSYNEVLNCVIIQDGFDPHYEYHKWLELNTDEVVIPQEEIDQSPALQDLKTMWKDSEVMTASVIRESAKRKILEMYLTKFQNQ
jgi:hypothetical protein